VSIDLGEDSLPLWHPNINNTGIAVRIKKYNFLILINCFYIIT